MSCRPARRIWAQRRQFDSPARPAPYRLCPKSPSRSRACSRKRPDYGMNFRRTRRNPRISAIPNPRGQNRRSEGPEVSATPSFVLPKSTDSGRMGKSGRGQQNQRKKAKGREGILGRLGITSSFLVGFPLVFVMIRERRVPKSG
jgi:hypothetical protein